MLTKSKIVLSLALGLAVATVASPSFAQRTENHNDKARDAAIHECSVQAQKWSNTMWQTSQFAAYSNCMMEHGQRP